MASGSQNMTTYLAKGLEKVLTTNAINTDSLLYINTADTNITADMLGTTTSIAFTRMSTTGAYTTGHIVWLNAADIGTPFQLVVHDSSDLYLYKRWKSSGTWTEWTKMRAGTADTWTTARTLTIGNTGKSVDGSANVSWSKDEILGASTNAYFLRGDKEWSNTLNGVFTANGNITANNGMLKSTANGNTVTIGSQNATATHIYNSANIPFYFNRTTLIDGDLGNTSYPVKNIYMGTANGTAIYYKGSKATYSMIRFIDNASSGDGNGISIGGGGQTIIGGGESASTAAAQVGTAGSEVMYVCNDGNVDIISNLQNGWDSRKVMTFNTSGYLMLPSYINVPTNNNENPTVSQFIVTNGSDHYYRKASTAHAMAAIRGGASGTWGISVTGSSASCTGNSATTSKLLDSAHSWTATEVYNYMTARVLKAGDTMSGDLLFSNSGTTTRQVRGIVGDNDYWRIAGGATAANAGYMELATADDGNEPIYVRQYTGVFTTVKRTLTLLDANGNSNFPGNITCVGAPQTVTAANMAFNGGVQLREAGAVGNAQSAIEYGPRISFHWGNRVAKSITLHSNGTFYFRDQNGTTRSTIDANVVGALTGNVTGNCSGSSGSCTGNAATATKATNDGDGNKISTTYAKIAAHNNLTASGNEFTFASSGFSGAIWLNYRTAGGTNGNITQYNFGNGKGGSLASITSGTFNGNCSGSSGSCTGNAATATKLATARSINGTNFDGSDNITTANWGTARNITIKDSSSTNAGTAVSVNGSGAITLLLPATIKASITGNCSGSAGSATYASSYLADRGSVSGSSHAEALKAYFNSNKASEPRNCLVAHYSSAHSNGSLCFGYFLSGHDSAPYGGFFVCHYNNPRYVGISNGTYTQHDLITNQNYTSYTVTKTGSGASGSWGISITGSSASCTGNAATATALKDKTNGTSSYLDYGRTGITDASKFTWLCVWDGYTVAPASKAAITSAVKSSASGSWDISVTGSSASCTGNAATATKLGTANKGSSNHPIYLSGGTPTECAYPKSGAWWTAVPFIHSDGMMEIGRYIDFHGTNNTTADHTIRFTCATDRARIDCNGIFAATGWSDLAEYRRTIEHEPGRAVIPTDCGIARRATGRLQPGARIVSDTYGFCLGESDDEQSPIALTGRVLAYPCRPISEYHAGDAVCSGPNGTVDLMTREEIQKYPDCIVGIVNEIPTYPIWNPKHTDDRQKVVFNENVEVRGRIWIDVK